MYCMGCKALIAGGCLLLRLGALFCICIWGLIVYVVALSCPSPGHLGCYDSLPPSLANSLTIYHHHHHNIQSNSSTTTHKTLSIMCEPVSSCEEFVCNCKLIIYKDNRKKKGTQNVQPMPARLNWKITPKSILLL